MKKKLFAFVSAVALLAAIPTTGFAAPVKQHVTIQDVSDAKSIQGFGDVTILELMLNTSGVLDSDGEKEYTFDYEATYGNTIRYYLSDDNQNGMSIKIYDSGNNLVASGHTDSGNGWQYLNTFTPAAKDQTFTVRIVSDDGDGGGSYPFSVAVRAF